MSRQAWRSVSLTVALALLAGCQTLPGWMVVQRKAQVTDYQHFDNAPIARAVSPWALPVQPEDLRWPRGQSPAEMAAWAEANGTQALLVLQRGRVVYEGYFNGFARDSIGTSFSVAKSFVSVLLGIAIAEGRIAGIDEPITRYLPELLGNDPRFVAITLRHLLKMRSGIAFDESYDTPFSEAARFYLASSLPAQVAKLHIAGPPDQAYSYQSGDTQLLAMALERAIGQHLAAYAQARLWQPMGAEFDASWSLDSAASGVTKGFCCLNARAIDLARFGQLVLQGGQRDGRAIIPADWLRASTAAQSLAGNTDIARRNVEARGGRYEAFYAWQWRRAPLPSNGATPAEAIQPGPNFYAQGLLGQYVYVAPEAEMVVVRLGTRRGDVFWAGWMGNVARLNP